MSENLKTLIMITAPLAVAVASIATLCYKEGTKPVYLYTIEVHDTTGTLQTTHTQRGRVLFTGGYWNGTTYARVGRNPKVVAPVGWRLHITKERTFD